MRRDRASFHRLHHWRDSNSVCTASLDGRKERMRCRALLGTLLNRFTPGPLLPPASIPGGISSDRWRASSLRVKKQNQHRRWPRAQMGEGRVTEGGQAHRVITSPWRSPPLAGRKRGAAEATEKTRAPPPLAERGDSGMACHFFC